MASPVPSSSGRPARGGGRGVCAATARTRRESYKQSFNEILTNLIAFARDEGERGVSDARTRRAARELRRLYREALER